MVSHVLRLAKMATPNEVTMERLGGFKLGMVNVSEFSILKTCIRVEGAVGINHIQRDTSSEIP